MTQTFRELGVTTVWEQMDLGDGSISTAIRDSDGNLINVFQEGASPIG
ncbi:VOC family protein [Streptomyces sp. NPDC088763]